MTWLLDSALKKLETGHPVILFDLPDLNVETLKP
jgi:hypothetical protein